MTDLLAAVRTDPILEPYAGELARAARSSVRLRLYVPDSQLRIGSSKIGGHPDVPLDFTWPTRFIEVPEPSAAYRETHPDLERPPRDGVIPLEFIAQINLGDASPFDADGILPPDGLLLFFYGDQLYEAEAGAASAGSYHRHPDGTVHERSGMRFGRTLYFYVRGSALKQRDFSGAWYDMD